MRTEFGIVISLIGWGLLFLIMSLSHFFFLANMVLFQATYQPISLGTAWSEVEKTWGPCDETFAISNDPSGVSFAQFYYRPDLLVLLDENNLVKAIIRGDRVIDLNPSPLIDFVVVFVISLFFIVLSGHITKKTERLAIGLSMVSFLWILIFEERLLNSYYTSGSLWMIIVCLCSMTLFLAAFALMLMSTYHRWRALE